MAIKIKKKIQIQGVIRALTGLHIGGSNLSLNIGGADAVVIRNPFNSEPYIPGSSLKGKMRSLIERLEGKYTSSGVAAFGPYIDDPKDTICAMFGITPEESEKAIKKGLKDTGIEYKDELHALPSSRLIVRDCALTTDSARTLKNLKTTDMPYTEVKTEVVIDRITSKAMPRQLERVPAGAEFDFRLVLSIYEGDDEATYLTKIAMALALIESDYIGGKGTRGSGEVEFRALKVSQKTAKDYEALNQWQEVDAAKYFSVFQNRK